MTYTDRKRMVAQTATSAGNSEISAEAELGLTRSRGIPPMLALMRPHQWVKNLFVAAPLFFTPSALSFQSISLVLAGILCFCLLASAVYILNDYVDREVDRRHPTKRFRPLAAGLVSPGAALLLLGGLLTAGLIGSFALSPQFGALVAAYFVINIAYSFGLKNVSIIDVLTIALGFVLRVYGGAVLIGVIPSTWIIVCTGLVALFLALAKRRDDLVRALDGDHRRSLDGYTKHFLDTSVSIVLGALLIAYSIYTLDNDVTARVGSENLFLTIPFVIAGILRYLQIVLVEERSGSPTRLVLSDRFLITSMALWAVSFSLLIHL